MRVFEQLLFDEMILGSGTTWYTPDEYNDILGAADVLEFAAHVTNVPGTPTLNIDIEDSADGRHWKNIAIMHNTSISNNDIIRKTTPFTDRVNLSLVRLKISLAGANAQCRLKLYGMGRVT